jgi:hypothetical protein
MATERDGLPVALIDFDLAKPTTRLYDIANALWYWASFRRGRQWRFTCPCMVRMMSFSRRDPVVGAGDLRGILAGMTMTTIKVPKATRDRLHRLAAADGVTLAQEIDKLIREHAPRPRPATGGFRSSQPLTAEEIDGQLAAGFGE